MARDSSLIQRDREKIISAVSIGFFFILAGTIFLLTPNFIDKVTAFFNDFILVRAPNTEQVFLPAPSSPSKHLGVYMVVEEFTVIWGIFQLLILVLKVTFHFSSTSKAETISGIIFWLGISYLISLFLIVQATTIRWLVFWAMTITLIGVSQVIRAIVLAVKRR